jgi:LPXTG-site transpeptidase (sortase) family protein
MTADRDDKGAAGGNGAAGESSAMAAPDDPTVAIPIVEDTPKPPSTGRRWQVEAIASQVLMALAALLVGFVVFVFFLSALPAGRAQAGLERRFATPLSYGTALVGGHIPAGTPVARLDIPNIGVHAIVVEGTTANELRDGPGHLAASVLPGQVGNSVIAAHRLAFGGPFGSIHSLRRGALIDVVTGQGRFVYVVSRQEVVRPNDLGPFRASSDNQLTLVTAANIQASKRLVVVAILRGKPVGTPAGQPNVVSSGASGLVGSTAGIGALAWWSELLVLVAIGTVLCYRRLPRWSSYLITTPVVVLVAWLVYANLARLLPATL